MTGAIILGILAVLGVSDWYFRHATRRQRERMQRYRHLDHLSDW